MKIKYSEIFGSFQGEAEYAGMPSVWLRFFGCNLKCNGFGQKDPTNESAYILPYKYVKPDEYKTLEQLPIFDYGCDSSYSWDPSFNHLVHTVDVVEVVDKFEEILKNNFGCEAGSWVHPGTGQAVQLCFTGGEPMLWQKQMAAITAEIERRASLTNDFDRMPLLITIETNATQPIKYRYFDEITANAEIHFACSPKLFHVSGETAAVKFDILSQYSSYASSMIIKFVHNGSKDAWAELDTYITQLNILRDERVVRPVNLYIMPVGATKEQQELPTVAEISDEAMRRGFMVATRNHTYIYKNIIGK